jgi:hypothetical protein
LLFDLDKNDLLLDLDRGGEVSDTVTIGCLSNLFFLSDRERPELPEDIERGGELSDLCKIGLPLDNDFGGGAGELSDLFRTGFARGNDWGCAGELSDLVKTGAARDTDCGGELSDLVKAGFELDIAKGATSKLLLPVELSGEASLTVGKPNEDWLLWSGEYGLYGLNLDGLATCFDGPAGTVSSSPACTDIRWPLDIIEAELLDIFEVQLFRLRRGCVLESEPDLDTLVTRGSEGLRLLERLILSEEAIAENSEPLRQTKVRREKVHTPLGEYLTK